MEPKTSCSHRNNQPKQKYPVTGTAGACTRDGRDKHAHAHAHANTLCEGKNAHTHTHTCVQRPMSSNHFRRSTCYSSETAEGLMRAQFFFRTTCERWRPGEKERG